MVPEGVVRDCQEFIRSYVTVPDKSGGPSDCITANESVSGQNPDAVSTSHPSTYGDLP